MPIALAVQAESYPLNTTFVISRGAKTAAEVVVAELRDGDHIGRGECVPYARYDETVDGVAAALHDLTADVAQGLDRAALQDRLPPGAARNALDCAFWDLEAKRAGVAAWQLAGLAPPQPVTSAVTITLDTPDAMAAQAQAQAGRRLLKLKVAGAGDLDRVRAVRAAAPDSRLIVDANEGWTPADFADPAAALQDLGVELIEQPLPAGDDDALSDLARPIPVCADESCHDRASLTGLAGKYDAVNVKLDKTGGLTEALALAEAAHTYGFALMVGCMVGSSLAMAPALLVAQRARWVDLDGPLFLTRDREPGLAFAADGMVAPAPAALWG